METFESIISLLDMTLSSKRRRHIMGGMLLSLSFLFGSLAITIMTLKIEERPNEF